MAAGRRILSTCGGGADRRWPPPERADRKPLALSAETYLTQ
jgi:hypothetical protein